MDLVIVIVATLTAILAVGYTMVLARVDEIKENWVQYRCNPLYMPFSSFVGVDTANNFMQCSMTSFKDYLGFILDPIQNLFGTFLAMFSSIATSLDGMRKMFNGIRSGFLGIVSMIFGKIANTLASMQYLMIRIRTVFMRVAAIMYSMMNVMSTGVASGKSVMNGPIGKTISFLCFAPETPVELASGHYKEMGAIDVGDVLRGGHTVTGTYAFMAPDEKLYCYNGILVTGSHRLADGTRIDQSNAVLSDETRPVVVCLDTDTGFIQLGTTLFRDFEFESPENPYKVSESEGSENIAGLRRRTNQWEVLVRGT
jgi:hypothetical protein